MGSDCRLVGSGQQRRARSLQADGCPKISEAWSPRSLRFCASASAGEKVARLRRACADRERIRGECSLWRGS